MTTTKSQFEKAAKDYFKLYPSAEYILVTEDGLFFTSKDKKEAEKHAERKKIVLLRFDKNKTEKTSKTTTSKK